MYIKKKKKLKINLTCNIHYSKVCFMHVTVHLLCTCSSVTGVGTVYIVTWVHCRRQRKHTLHSELSIFHIFTCTATSPPMQTSQGFYIWLSQLVRYARICTSKVDFVNKLHRLSLHRKQQGFKCTLSSNPLTNSSRAMGSSSI